MSKISINDVVKKYGNKTVIKNISLEIEDGEFFTLLGPSGCGKTTLLRMIAGFNTIEDGEIYFNDTKINNMDPSKRNIGMVFQNYAVFPNMTVRENIAFGLKERKVSKDVISREVDNMIKLMKLEEHADKKPQALSGGQQQRVALARAIVIKPDVLLMDEPLSNLDAKLRVDLRQTIRDIQKEVGITTVYVTHDQEEAMAVSDRIAVMKDGIICQLGTPQEIYHRPANDFVASFIGSNNLIEASVKKCEGKTLIDMGEFVLDASNLDINEDKILISVRPEDLRIDNMNGLNAEVADSVFLGESTHYTLRLTNGLLVHMNEHSNFNSALKVGDKVKISLNVNKVNILSSDGKKNLGVLYEG